MTVRQLKTARVLNARRFRFLVLYCNTPVKPRIRLHFDSETPPGQLFAVPAVWLWFHYLVAPQLQR